jgi:hypothetical protein
MNSLKQHIGLGLGRFEQAGWFLLTSMIGVLGFMAVASSADASTELATKAAQFAQTQAESGAAAKRLAECTAAAMDMPGVTFSKALTIGTSPALDGTLCEYRGLSGVLQKVYTTLGLDNKEKTVQVLESGIRVLTKIKH